MSDDASNAEEALVNARAKTAETVALSREEIRQETAKIGLDAVKRHRAETPSHLEPHGNPTTQTVYYRSVKITDIDFDEDGLEPITHGIDLGLQTPEGYERPAVGVRITTEQTWQPMGIALGQLLHSIALAPGEVTKVAVLDWQRRAAGRASESTSQDEALRAENQQDTAHSDVTSSVAHETQHGSSNVNTNGASSQSGTSNTSILGGFFGGGGGGGILGSMLGGGGGLFGGGLGAIGSMFGGGGGGGLLGGIGSLFGGGGSKPSSIGSSSNSGVSTSVSRTSGEKDVSLSETDWIHSLTSQAASSSRSRRAASIQETSQDENETASSRVLANYNHMHTLNVMYYDVVQKYHVRTRVKSYERLLFIPFKPLTFDAHLVDQYALELLAAALHRAEVHWAETILRRNASENVGPGLSPPDIDGLCGHLNINTLYYSSVIWMNMNSLQLSRALRYYSYEGRSVAASVDLRPVAITGNYLGFVWPFAPGDSAPTPQRVYTFTEDDRQRPAAGTLMDVSLLNPRYRLGDVLVSVTTVDQVTTTLNMGPANRDANESFVIPMQDIAMIQIDITAISPVKFGAGHPPAFTIMAYLGLQKNDGRVAIPTLLTMLPDPDPNDPARQTFSASAQLLTGKTIYGPPPDEAEEEWYGQFNDHAVTEGEIDLPTGGVFAEGVLGSATAAEKLDMSRFWNWQDSPIPILPPDINPVDVASRYQNAAAATHGLETSAAALQQLGPVPMLQGLLAASDVMKSNLFRDMSGAKEAAQNAAAALGEAGKNADSASKTAMEGQMAAMQNAADLIGKAMDTMTSIEAPEATAAKGLMGGDGAPKESLSEKGAEANLKEVNETTENAESAVEKEIIQDAIKGIE
ncbi:MAG: hypothetical protein QNJ09_01220 [Paracoccaceae bacterium]|nr:hypothetical protein [Paracoccaceae bacterium]